MREISSGNNNRSYFEEEPGGVAGVSIRGLTKVRILFNPLQPIKILNLINDGSFHLIYRFYRILSIDSYSIKAIIISVFFQKNFNHLQVILII